MEPVICSLRADLKHSHLEVFKVCTQASNLGSLQNGQLQLTVERCTWVKSEEIEELRRQLLNCEEVRSGFFYVGGGERFFKTHKTSEERENK